MFVTLSVVLIVLNLCTKLEDSSFTLSKDMKENRGDLEWLGSLG